MKRTKRRMTLCTVLLICNLVFIWGNSLLPAEVSGQISGTLTYTDTVGTGMSTVNTRAVQPASAALSRRSLMNARSRIMYS